MAVNWNQLLGLGLTTGGLLADKEPGQVTEARQFLRNRFTNPNALATQFSSDIGGLQTQFQPLLDQQRQNDIKDISQRFASAFPSSVGAQGPEFGSIAKYINEQALPREQGLLGNLGLDMLNLQGNAAGTILNTGKPDPFAQLASLIGANMLLNPSGGSGGQGGLNLGSLFGGSGGLGNLLGGSAQSAGSGIGSFLSNAGTQLGGLLQSGTSGIPGLSGLLSGQGFFGAPGLSGMGLASSIGSGGLGYGVGNLIGSNFGSNQFQSGLGGAVGGAATGFAVGGPVGAVIGAIAGGIGGALGRGNAVQQQKQASINAETQQVNAARPAAIQSADQGAQLANQTASQLQQLASNPQVTQALQQLYQTDPEVQALIKKFQTEVRISANGDPMYRFDELLSNPLAGIVSDLKGAANVLTNDTNPNGVRALLSKSNEVGQFNPSNATAQDFIRRLQTGIDIANQLIAKLGIQ